MWVSNGLLVWSILTLVVVVACSITVLFFQAQNHGETGHLHAFGTMIVHVSLQNKDQR